MLHQRKNTPRWGCFFFGGAEWIISELYPREIHFELSQSPPDVWGRQLAAGGSEESRTPQARFAWLLGGVHGTVQPLGAMRVQTLPPFPVRFTKHTVSFPPPAGVRRAPSNSPKKKTPRVGGVFSLVDPRRVELLSESLFTGPSPWAVYDLKFPLEGGHRQSPPAGSPFMHDRYKCELSIHVHHYMTPHPWSWSSSAERAA